MNIDSSDTIGGFPILKVRDYLRKERCASIQGIIYHFQIPEAESAKAKTLLDALITEGYADRKPEEAYPGCDPDYRLTEKGSRLAYAQATKPIKRATADRLVAGFLERCAEMNAPGSKFPYRVKRVVAFGSYLTEKPKIGDIDLAVQLIRAHPGDYDSQLKLEREFMEASGKSFPSLFAELMAGSTLCWQFLRNRSTYLSLASLEREDIQAILNKPNVPTKELYSWDDTPSDSSRKQKRQKEVS